MMPRSAAARDVAHVPLAVADVPEAAVIGNVRHRDVGSQQEELRRLGAGHGAVALEGAVGEAAEDAAGREEGGGAALGGVGIDSSRNAGAVVRGLLRNLVLEVAAPTGSPSQWCCPD